MPATQPQESQLDLLYGIKAIAAALGLREGQARHLAEQGHIPVFKVGHMVCSRRTVLKNWLDKQLDAAPPQGTAAD